MEEESRNPRPFSAVGCLVLVVVGVLGVLFFWPAIQVARDSARRALCANFLKEVGAASQAYQRQHGFFPAAYQQDARSKMLHGWRVSLLPFMNQQPLFDQYNVEESWDSPDNFKIAEQTQPSQDFWAYHCPGASRGKSPETYYLMLVGPDAFSEGGRGRKLDEFKDGLSQTIMVAESCDSGIVWTEPRDLSVTDMTYYVDDYSKPGIRSVHNGGTNLLMTDGSIKSICKHREHVPPGDIRAMITIAAHDEDWRIRLRDERWGEKSSKRGLPTNRTGDDECTKHDQDK